MWAVMRLNECEGCLAPGSLESRDCPECGAVAGISSGSEVGGFVALASFHGVNAPTMAGCEPSLWCY